MFKMVSLITILKGDLVNYTNYEKQKAFQLSSMIATANALIINYPFEN